MRAEFNGTVIADSSSPIREGNDRYFLPGEVRIDLLERSGRIFHCPDIGYADLYSFRLGDDIREDIAWMYAHPYPAASHLAGLYGFKRSTLSDDE
jgi:uncharacterized protein (DUF427 family)